MTKITEDINYNKVVFVQVKRWRIAREREFKYWDIELLKAIEEDNKDRIKEIAAIKKQLRDITNYDFSTVTSLKEIYDIWPEILGQNDIPA